MLLKIQNKTWLEKKQNNLAGNMTVIPERQCFSTAGQASKINHHQPQLLFFSLNLIDSEPKYHGRRILQIVHWAYAVAGLVLLAED